MRWMDWIIAAAFFTASCDRILNVQIGGSLRFAQVLMFAICIAGAARILQDGRVLWPRGSTALALWMVLQFLYIPFSGVMAIGLQFFLLLAFTVAGIFALVQLYGSSSNHAETLMRLYMISFVFIAIVGLLQFAAPFFGLPAFYSTQRIAGRIARINAFSYEPSYFATYMVMGWIMLVDLRMSHAKIASGTRWKWATIAVTAAFFLCTSKTAWAFMLLELVARATPFLFRVTKNLFVQLLHGHVLYRIPQRGSVRNGILWAAVLVAGAAGLHKIVANPLVFLSGTGIGGTASHSVENRDIAAHVTWEAFKDHPWIGRSLGGVSVYIGTRGGAHVQTMDQVRMFWGFPVLLDVLVASGISGFIPFLIFLYSVTIGAYHLALRYWPQERAKWVRALARAMIFEWLTLMTDQNLMRVYIWMHISMVVVIAYNLEFGTVPVAAPERALQAYSGHGSSGMQEAAASS